MDELVNKTLGQFQITRELGRGGMAIVYEAFQPALQRKVAIKVLLPSLSSDAAFVQRFQHEAIAAASLRHPNIVTIHDVGSQDRYSFIVMEYLDGRPLSDVIRAGGPMPLARICTIIEQVALALDYAHEHGFVHRDIKPGNVMLREDEHATLTDFGIARALVGTHLTQTGTMIGTPEYMSPEQVTGAEIDRRTDVYALGIVAYEMVTGQVPFSGTTASVLYRQAHESPPPLRDHMPGVSLAVEGVILCALAKRRDERYATAGQFAQALTAAATGQGLAPTAHLPTAPTVSAPPQQVYAPPPRPAYAAPSQAVYAPPPVTPHAGGLRGGLLWLLAGGGVALLLCAVVTLVALLRPGRNGETNAVATLAAQLTADARTAAKTPLRPTDTMVPATQVRPPELTSTPTPRPPATETPSPAEREMALLSRVRYRQGNGDVIFAYRIKTPPTMDGRLDEWAGHLYDIPHVVYPLQKSWSGPSDLSGRFHIGWDADNLYVGVEVIDNVHVVQSGKLLYNGDDIEIQIDSDLLGDFNDSKLSNDDDGQLGFTAGDWASRRPEAYIWRPPSREQPGTMIAVATQPTSSGYTLEAAIPWWTLGGRPPIETAVGICFNLSDNDTPDTAEQRTMISTSPTRMWGNPTTWGTLILVDWR